MFNLMKIAIFKYATQFGGGEKYTQLLCNGFKQHQIEVALISNYHKLILTCPAQYKIYCRRLPETITRKNIISWIFLILIETVNYFSIALKLRLRGYRSIILQDLNDKLLLPPICRLLGVKVYWVEHTNWQPYLPRYPFFCWLKYNAHFIDKIIVPSRACANQILPFPQFRKKVIIINHGVPRANIKQSDDTPNIVVITRLSPEKGVDLLLQVAAKIGNCPPITIFGDGPQKDELISLARRLNIKADFRGHINEPYRYIFKNDIFVLPSRVENFPLSILEALSAGLVIVAPQTGGIPEILNDTDNLLFKPNDIDDLTRQIKKAISLPPSKANYLRLANQKLWQKRYNSNGMVKNTISLIKSP